MTKQEILPRAARKSLSNKRFGRLLVIGRDLSRVTKGSFRFWRCLCDCGKYASVERAHLTSGDTQSCGCLKQELEPLVAVRYRKTHGASTPTPEYRAWSGMKGRCYRQSSSNYLDYGGRGIKVCDNWLNSFENFLRDVGLRPSAHHSLDRINVNGDYSPDNFRWASKTEQSNNRRKFIRNSEHNAEVKRLQAIITEYEQRFGPLSDP